MGYLDLIDTRTPGPRYDVTPLFANAAAFRALAEDLARPFAAAGVDAVAGIDALGFILGTAVAWRLGTGLVAIRKAGKLPVPVLRQDFVDYTGQAKALELRPDVIRAGGRYLIVDEWIETGAQVEAAAALLERAGGQVAGLAAINMDDSPRAAALRARYLCHTVWEEPPHETSA